MTTATNTAYRYDPAAGAAYGWGNCPKCKRWRTYDTGECPVCEHALEGHVIGETKELARQFFGALMLVQDAADTDDDIKAIVDVRFWFNASTDAVKRAIRVLNSAAILSGLMTTQTAAGGSAAAMGGQQQQQQQTGTTIATFPDGSQWLMEYRGSAGLVPLRQIRGATVAVPPAPAPAAASADVNGIPFDPVLDADPPSSKSDNNAFAGSASASGSPTPALRLFTKACDVCGEPVTHAGGFGLARAMKAHAEAAHPDEEGR